MRFEDLKAGSTVAGGGTKALSIIGTVGTGVLLSGAMGANGNCGGCNNGGILSNIFGNNDCHCHYETKESAFLREQVAILAGERYADSVGLGVYTQLVAESKEQTATANAKFEAIYQRMYDTDKTLCAELARIDKETALNKQANEFVAQSLHKDIKFTNREIEYQGVILNNKIDCTNAQTLCYVNATFVPGKLVMPLDSICPAAMPLCSTDE